MTRVRIPPGAFMDKYPSVDGIVKAWEKVKREHMEPELTMLIGGQFVFHKGITVQDIYKLLYQSVYGADHLVQDKESARKFFFREVSELVIPEVKEVRLPILSTISEGQARVNFIPYALAGGDFNKLFDIFVDDAPESLETGNNILITDLSETFIEINKKKSWFPQKETKDFFNLVKQSNFPPMHHSESYRDLLTKDILTKPHYRVILTDRLFP